MAEAVEPQASNNRAEGHMQRLTIFSVLCAFAAAAPESGPSIGSRFPGDLGAVLGPKGAAIFVYSSTDTCPVCRSLIQEIAQRQGAFHKQGVNVAAMSDERVPSLRDLGRVARPGWFVLDGKGTIVAKYFENEHNQCYTAAAVLVHRFGWTPPELTTQVEGKQLTATIGASNATVVPGHRVALTMDIDLQPGMHVYAPGVEGYIPIDWKMQDSASASVHPPVFPRSEKLYLKAIDETVPAYRNRFRLTRDITIPPDDRLQPALDGSGHFTVNGSLRYQACDDRVCYIPQELRLQWTFEYQPLDNQRVAPEQQRRPPAD
jgi:hypothetical protein